MSAEPKPPPLDVAEQGEVQTRSRSLKDRQRELDKTIGLIMSQPNGRAWVWDTLSGCHVYATSFRGDPHLTSFNEGERNVGLRLMAQLARACPDHYATMIKENSDER